MRAARPSGPKGRVAVVTGAAHGIGWAIARGFAARGLRVVLADLDEKTLAARARELGSEHRTIPVDLTKPGAGRALISEAHRAMGALDVVVNNAGATDTSGRAILDLDGAAFDRLIALNLMAVEEICEAALQTLPSGGSIVSLASGAAFRPLALRGAYSSTKAGVVALTKTLAPRAEKAALSICAIAPGYTRTPLVEALEREGRVDLAQVAAQVPMGEIATPEDIAEAVCFAALGGAALNGATWGVDGGSALGVRIEGAAPSPGQGTGLGPQGGHVVWGDDALAAALAQEEGPVSGLTDATLLEGAPMDTLAVLQQIRARARRCALDLNRTRAFALTVVIGGSAPLTHATRAAADMLLRTLALEWAPGGLRVNTIIWHGTRRAGLAELCAFLASPGARLITGQTLHAGVRLPGSKIDE